MLRFFITSVSIGKENIMLAMVMLPLGQDLKLSLLPARFGIICHQLRNSLFGYSSVIRYLYLGREATCLSQRFTLSAAMPAMRIAAPTAISLSGLPLSTKRMTTNGTHPYRTAQNSQLSADSAAEDSPAV